MNRGQELNGAVRSSETAWIEDDQDSGGQLSELSKRVSQISGQPVSHFEKWQAAAYGPGGRFDEHSDHLVSFNELPSGGRLSTLLIYLTDEHGAAPPPGGGLGGGSFHTGGATRFPALGVAVTPRRGTALYFHNVQVGAGQVLREAEHAHALEPDARAVHAGLPVKAGQKVILSKWVHPLPHPGGRGTATGVGESVAQRACSCFEADCGRAEWPPC